MGTLKRTLRRALLAITYLPFNEYSSFSLRKLRKEGTQKIRWNRWVANSSRPWSHSGVGSCDRTLPVGA